MTLTIKIASIALGATRGTLISDLLKEDGKVLNTETEWTEAWGKYLGADQKQNKWGFKGTLNKSKVEEQFKEECKNRINLRVSSKEDQDYKDFLAWCAKAQ